jgi:pteridine reductase
MSLSGKTILITGAARRLGRVIALAAAENGANLILHYNSSQSEIEITADEVRLKSCRVWTVQADLATSEGAKQLITDALKISHIFGLVNNASLFKPVDFFNTSIEDWETHIHVNLTTPFLLTQKFAEAYNGGSVGRIVNMLDWRSLRPGVDHFPYTISKAALAALTKATARKLAPKICVNGIALGAILPPEGESENSNIINSVPMQRWATLDELTRTVMFLLDGPEYITGEIIHLDGGRHLV